MSRVGKVKDLTGQKFGRLLVVKLIGLDKKGTSVWECRCTCGNLTNVRGYDLRSGNTKSCGCFRKEQTSKDKTKHGLSKDSFYCIWQGLKQRCLNPNHVYYTCYGGRGIKVCDSWLDFINFKEDMYESYLEHVALYGEKDTSIDRIDVNGNYEPNNCRWVTYEEQGGNKRNNRLFKATSPDNITYISKNQREFARNNNLDYRNLNACLRKKEKTHKKWTFEYIESEI